MAKAGLGPRQYRSVIPPETFKRIDKLASIAADRLNAARERRYAMVGTPAEIGARAAQRDAATALAYGSGLPFGDEYSQATFLEGGGGGAGGYSASDPYSQLREQTQRMAQFAQADAARKEAEALVEPAPIEAPPIFEGYKTPRVSRSKVKPWRPKGEGRDGRDGRDGRQGRRRRQGDRDERRARRRERMSEQSRIPNDPLFS